MTPPPHSPSSSSSSSQCWELQGFIQPLAELLEGLKRGRYDRGGSPLCPPPPSPPQGGLGGSHGDSRRVLGSPGLSSFQQSVAMDRIQRIIGVLQKPEMG